MIQSPFELSKGYIEAQSRLSLPKTLPGSDLPVVTISRQTGAGAISISRLTVRLLNVRDSGRKAAPWTVFDGNLVKKMLEDHGLPVTVEKFVREDATAFDLRSGVEELLGLHPSDWTLVEHTSDTILRLAHRGNVILIGRGSNLITRHLKNAFHVRLVGPLSARIKHIAEYYDLPESDAAELVRETDRACGRYVKRNFHAAIDDPEQYHLTINTGLMTFEEAARLIAFAVPIPAKKD